MKKLLLAFVLTILSLLFITGCGSSSSSDEDEIKGTITTYINSVKDQNGEDFCNSLSQKNIDDILGQLQQAGDALGVDADSSCPEVMDKVLQMSGSTVTDKEYQKVADGLEEATIEVNGSEATVQLPEGTAGNEGSDTINLIQEDGDWKISADPNSN